MTRPDARALVGRFLDARLNDSDSEWDIHIWNCIFDLFTHE